MSIFIASPSLVLNGSSPSIILRKGAISIIYEKEFTSGLTITLGNTLIPPQRLFFGLRWSASSRAIKSASRVFSRMFLAILSDFLERFVFTLASALIVAPLRKVNILDKAFFSVPTPPSMPAVPSIPELTSVINSVVFLSSPPAMICMKSATNASSKYTIFKKFVLSIILSPCDFLNCCKYHVYFHLNGEQTSNQSSILLTPILFSII